MYTTLIQDPSGNISIRSNHESFKWLDTPALERVKVTIIMNVKTLLFLNDAQI